MLALQWIGDLSEVNPAFCPMTAGIGFSWPVTVDTLNKIDGVRRSPIKEIRVQLFC